MSQRGRARNVMSYFFHIEILSLIVSELLVLLKVGGESVKFNFRC